MHFNLDRTENKKNELHRHFEKSSSSEIHFFSETHAEKKNDLFKNF